MESPSSDPYTGRCKTWSAGPGAGWLPPPPLLCLLMCCPVVLCLFPTLSIVLSRVCLYHGLYVSACPCALSSPPQCHVWKVVQQTSLQVKTGRDCLQVPLQLVSDSRRLGLPAEAEIRRVFLEEKVTALVLCSPHNPGGVLWTRQELELIATVCCDCGVFVIADEIHADLALFAGVHTPMAVVCESVGHKDVATLGSASKAWNLAGLHCGWVALQDAGLREQYMAVVEHACLHFGSVFASIGMLGAYTVGAEWLSKAKAHIEANIILLEERLAALPGTPIKPIRPEATYLVWLECSGLGKNGVPPAAGELSELDRFFQEEVQVKLSDGFQFGFGEWSSYMRINVACAQSTLLAVLDRLDKAVVTMHAKQ